MKQLTTELKQARKELDKNFSMRVRHIAETDTEGELKTCRRQLKWLEEENQASKHDGVHFTHARIIPHAVTAESQGQ